MAVTVSYWEVPEDGVFTLENTHSERMAYWIPNSELFYTSHIRGFLEPSEIVTIHIKRRPGVAAMIEIRWIRVSPSETDLVDPFTMADEEIIRTLVGDIMTVIEATQEHQWEWLLKKPGFTSPRDSLRIKEMKQSRGKARVYYRRSFNAVRVKADSEQSSAYV